MVGRFREVLLYCGQVKNHIRLVKWKGGQCYLFMSLSTSRLFRRVNNFLRHSSRTAMRSSFSRQSISAEIDLSSSSRDTSLTPSVNSEHLSLSSDGGVAIFRILSMFVACNLAIACHVTRANHLQQVSSSVGLWSNPQNGQYGLGIMT